ncbi:MAG: leucine-rich repeat domain-containing protein [Pirellulales bacterium]
MDRSDFQNACEGSAADAAVHFKCDHLEAAIREVLNKNEGVITRQDLAAMEELAANEEEITDLTGLEYAANLTDLFLNDNLITDVTPLASLTQLTHLWLYNNQITDVTPLAGMAKLTKLFLNNNQITDVMPLAGLTNLETLWLGNNQLTDDQQNMLREALPNCNVNFMMPP